MNQTQFQKAAGISAGLAARWYPHITAAMKDCGITAPLDQAMFIAQCGHESLGFNRVVENFNYSIAGLADFVRYGRLTQDQANSLGRSQSETVLTLERQRAIANIVYSKRLGNNRATDGWVYRGRGLIQITGLSNYRGCGSGLKVDLVAQPELLEQFSCAVRTPNAKRAPVISGDDATGIKGHWPLRECGCVIRSVSLRRDALRCTRMT